MKILMTKYVINQAKTATLVGILNVGVLGVAIMSSQIWLKGEARINAVGIVGAALNILMYGSPLAAMVSISCFLQFPSKHLCISLFNINVRFVR